MDQISKYFENKDFILWVFEPSKELDSFWVQYETEHPEEKRNIHQARRVLLKFRTSNRNLTEEEKIVLFTRVLREVEERQSTNKTRKLVLALLKYAAVALLFFSLGALFFYKQNQVDPQFFNQKLAVAIPENSAKLIRANGENILLKEDKSILKYGLDGNLVVNNDTIRNDHSDRSTDVPMNQLIIPYGKTSEVLLSDGTTVFLNAGSRLIYPEAFTGKTREVFLSGEAFFDVKKDAKHPFIVQLDVFRIKVFGTRFNVSAYPTDKIVETVLAEGNISMIKNNSGLLDKAIALMPNQLASFDRITNETSLKTVNTDNYILWTTGLLKFESADLNRIVQRLERYYNIRIEIKDLDLGNLHISGKLELKDDPDEICERVARAASVKIIKKDKDLYEILR